MERKKYLGQYNKPFIKSITSKIVRTDTIGTPGYASLVQIDEVHYPCYIGEKDSQICIADNGYSELTFLPDNENWQVVAIYDNHGNIIEWYFDITRKNSIDKNGTPYCDDLYLDAALLPNGRIFILDEDELENALHSGNITQADFDMAHATLQKLIADGIISVPYMEDFCAKLKSLLHLFTHEINNWDDWGNVFQSIPAFAPLIEHIFRKENLPMGEITHLTPGTNVVFRVGTRETSATRNFAPTDCNRRQGRHEFEYVIKIFAPIGVGDGYGTSVDVELFGMRLANAHGVPSPKLLAHGEVRDKYNFKYMIMELIHGKNFNDAEAGWSDADKFIIGQNVRKLTNRLNIPCEKFSPIDVLEHAKSTKSDWEEKGFPPSFIEEWLAYLNGLEIPEAEEVYCHADFHGENMLVDDQLNVYLVDFADAMHAPAAYEQLYVLSALFDLEKPYMQGYFGGDYDPEYIVDLCMKWMPVHAWGHSTASDHLKPTAEVASFEVMRRRLREIIK